jgi:uncharacterized protein YjbI with pentapeptide repeats
LAAHLTAEAHAQFEWRDASGNVRSLRELEEILQEHQPWIKSGEKAGTQATLASANLTDADLTYAQLQRAFLSSANLTNAILDGANLKG